MEMKNKEQENKAAEQQMLMDHQRHSQQQYQDVLKVMTEQLTKFLKGHFFCQLEETRPRSSSGLLNVYVSRRERPSRSRTHSVKQDLIHVLGVGAKGPGLLYHCQKKGFP